MMYRKSHKVDNKSLQEWKESFAKDGIKYDTDEEYYEAINNFVSFIDLLIEIDRSNKESKENRPEADSQGHYLIREKGEKIIL